jgi:hypothetical protein
MGMSAQQMLQNDPEYLARQLAQQEIQRYQNFQNPQLGLASTSGAVLGRGLANLFGGRGFFEVSDPALRRAAESQRVFNEVMTSFDPENPAASYEAMSRKFSELGYGQQAMMAAQEASKYRREARAETREEKKLDIQLAELGIKRGTALRQAETDERNLLEFFKKNPEQSSIALQSLAAQIERDPTNQVLLDKYNKIAQAGTSGAMEVSAKTERSEADIKKDKLLIQKYQQELDDTRKLKPADRYDAEIDAARDLLKTYKIDITKPLEGQVSAQVLYGPIAGELTNAYERALRRKTTEMGGATAPAPGAAPGPAAAPTSGASRVIDFNALPK